MVGFGASCTEESGWKVGKSSVSSPQRRQLSAAFQKISPHCGHLMLSLIVSLGRGVEDGQQGKTGEEEEALFV